MTDEVIEAAAPVRICDFGGWTDTWFGGPGRIVNVAVAPGVHVSISERDGPSRTVLDVADFGDRYVVVPGAERAPRHRLLEAALDALPPPDGRTVEITVRSAVPAGCGAGTSAAVTVTMLGALAALRSTPTSPRAVAAEAHRLEVEVLGAESGVQDQVSAAYGGINYIEIDHYPDTRVEALPPWPDLGPCLSLVFLGRAHDSSAVHAQVIEHVRAHGSAAFTRLREAAEAARRAVLDHDLAAFGQAAIDNTDAQHALHPGLVGSDATRVIDHARATGAIGWKVNGAGGEGGSVTLISKNPEAKVDLDRQVAAMGVDTAVLPVHVNQGGLQVRRVVRR